MSTLGCVLNLFQVSLACLTWLLCSGWNLLWCNHGDVDIESSWLHRVKSNDVDGNWHQILQQTGREREREREQVKKKRALKIIYSGTIFAPEGTRSSSPFSFLGSSPACVMPGRSYGDMEPQDYVLTSPGLNLRVPDVAVKCVPATAGSKVSWFTVTSCSAQVVKEMVTVSWEPFTRWTSRVTSSPLDTTHLDHITQECMMTSFLSCALTLHHD